MELGLPAATLNSFISYKYSIWPDPLPGCVIENVVYSNSDKSILAPL